MSDSASLREDLRHLIATSPFFDGAPLGAESSSGPSAASKPEPSLVVRYRADDQATTQAAREAFERAAVRGEVRADLDVDTAADILSGILFVRALTGQAAPSPHVSEAILDFVLRGICAR